MKALTPNERISRRNYLLMIFEGAVFWIAASFIDGNNVVSVFINEATGSLQLAGLAATLRSAATIVAQFFLGMLLGGVSNYGRTFHIINACSRWVIILMVPVLLLGATGTTAAIAAVVLITAFFFSDGFMGLFWQELSARTVPPKPRATIQGYQQVIGGVVGLGAAFVVKALMDAPNLTFTTRYAWIFGLCGGFYFINMFMLLGIKDFPENVKPKQKFTPPKLIPYLKSFVVLWKADPNFRKIMYGRILYVISSMISALVVLFGTDYAGLTSSQISSMLYIQVIGQILGGFTWVTIVKKWGNTAVMICSHVLPFTIAILGVGVHFFSPVIGNTASFIAVAAMVLLTGANLSSWTGYAQRIVDTVDPVKRTGYLILQSLIQFPFTFASYFAGLVAENFSFLPVFLAVAASSGAGLLLTTHLHRTAKSVEIRVETR